MATGYLIDTNVLIDAQMNRLPPKGSLFLAGIIDEDFTVSFVTYIEFLGYKSVSKETKEFMALATVIEIDKDIIDTCIALRKSRSIKLPDAIIAATALSKNLTLITRNTSDFKKIKGLELLNPHE
ncbi:type II toxin-antitoxin system VapC family toxin [Parapedobacter tibetensis]|uniref:type II toxin-antitoxin system VapC family toxin n=1 Tax=Parapedobacter tibetensis TaxID=2972951 RepID=UPI00214D3108|nr:type II toxin-antitoxin system VapC family toxin [Parapedobacter tibetensis]